MVNLNKYRLLFFLFCMCFSIHGFSQINKPEKDSTETVYKKIEDYSDKSKLNKLLHSLVFKSNKKPVRKEGVTNKQNYTNYEGKIIRNIKVESNDPFGFSFKDSTKTAKSWVEKTGNNLHLKSRDFAIKNFLIFKENTALDSLLLIESERLIRTQKFIREVEITVEDVGESQDSVDVYITTLDSWSLVPRAAFSNSRMKIQIQEHNFLGFGHELKVGGKTRYSDGKSTQDLLYTIPNFRNTLIGGTFGYNEKIDGYYAKHFNVQRTFVSPYTKWAAGIYLDEQFRFEMLPDASLERTPQHLRFKSQDFWGGYSFKLFKGQTERARTANLVSAIRLLNIDYKESPSVEYDSIGYFSDETFYLGSIGISSRRFVEDRFIFRDGIIETVPIGDIYAITAGKQFKNEQSRLYFGAKISHGNYYNWGYLSATIEYGSFFKKSEPEQTAYSFRANYFTNLISLGGNWKMRQFIKPQLLIGKNRLNTIADRVSIDETYEFQGFYDYEEKQKNSVGIPGFKSELLGTTKYVLGLQTQFYPPWEILGFRFNPYVNINTAMVGDQKTRAINGKLYSSFGVGLIVRNDYLVFNSIQLSLFYYPNMPGQGHDIFDTNVLNTEDFGIPGFELGKPSPIRYN